MTYRIKMKGYFKTRRTNVGLKPGIEPAPLTKQDEH